MSTDPAILLFRVRNLYTLNDRCKHSLKIKTMSWCPSTVHMLHLDCWTVDAIRYSIYTVYRVLCNRFLNRTEHPIHTQDCTTFVRYRCRVFPAVVGVSIPA